MLISSQGAKWHSTKLHRGLTYRPTRVPASSVSTRVAVCSAARGDLVVRRTRLALATVQSLSPVPRLRTICYPTFELHQHCLLSKIGLRFHLFLQSHFVVWLSSTQFE